MTMFIVIIVVIAFIATIIVAIINRSVDIDTIVIESYGFNVR